MSGNHLTHEQIERCRQYDLAPYELVGVYEHIDGCSLCRSLIARDLSEAVEDTQIGEVSGHLLRVASNIPERLQHRGFERIRMDLLLEPRYPMHLWDEQMVDYILDATGPEEREAAEGVLQVCTECRDEVDQIQRIKP